MRTMFSIVALAVLVACGGGGSAGSTSPQTWVTYFTSGGSGQTVSPGPCIASGSISGIEASVGPETVVSVASWGPGGGYQVFGYRGTGTPERFHAKPGETISVLGATLTLVDPSPAKGTNQGFTVSVRPSN
jgi:hypothetical protein